MEKIKIDSIRENPANPRTISKAKFELLKKSIKDFPEMLKLRPLVIDKDGVVLGGNMRLRALKALGYKDVPVIKAESLTEAQKKEFAIKDNASFGEWDMDLLANEWSDLPLADWGIDIPVTEPEVSEDDFEIPETIKTVLGVFYGISKQRIVKVILGILFVSFMIGALIYGIKANHIAALEADQRHKSDSTQLWNYGLMFKKSHSGRDSIVKVRTTQNTAYPSEPLSYGVCTGTLKEIESELTTHIYNIPHEIKKVNIITIKGTNGDKYLDEFEDFIHNMGFSFSIGKSNKNQIKGANIDTSGVKNTKEISIIIGWVKDADKGISLTP